MGSLWLSTNRWLTWFHRWAGIVLGLIFVAWFVTGGVLLYVPFPALAERDRLEHSEPIEAQRLTETPAAVLARAPTIEQLQLVSVVGRPVYLAFPANGKPMAIAGDSGSPLDLFSADTARTVAARFGGTGVRSVIGPFDYDQWIVHQHFDPFRPFYRVRLDDAAQTDLYVSARTGQVLQRTQGRERAWNWCGAVLHWIYFTPLRKSYPAWNQVVWWLSLAALLSSLVGTWLGFDRLVRVRARNRTKWSPYRGWMRWHHVVGLFAGVIVLVWIFSGWLSMDHGRLFSRGQPTTQLTEHLQGLPLEDIARRVPADFMRRVGLASEIDFGAVAGHPFMAARGAQAAEARIFRLEDASDAAPTPTLPTSLLISGLQSAWPQESLIRRAPTPDTDFYAVAESLGPSAVPFEIGGSSQLRVYVDDVTGKLLVVMNASRRAYAWVYYALHTFNFPALLDRPTLRAILVLVLLGVGLAFTGTGIVIGIQRLRSSLAR